MTETPWQEAHEYTIERSTTPITEDGYKIGEPKQLVCDGCGASALLTEEPSAGVDDLQHDRTCPNRFAKSDWYRSQL